MVIYSRLVMLCITQAAFASNVNLGRRRRTMYFTYGLMHVFSHFMSWRQTHGMLEYQKLQYIPRNMHTVFALLCFAVVIHWLVFPYPSGLLHWHCGNQTIAPVPAKQPWWIWINTSCEFIMNDCITTTKQSTTKPCAYFLGYTVSVNVEAKSYIDKWILGSFEFEFAVRKTRMQLNNSFVAQGYTQLCVYVYIYVYHTS